MPRPEPATELVYESVSVSHTRDSFKLSYRIDGDPYVRTFSWREPLVRLSLQTIESVAFHLGLFILMDYDQQHMPGRVIIRAGHMTEEQIEFYIKIRNLYARQHLFEKRAPLDTLTRDISTMGPRREYDSRPLASDTFIIGFGAGKESTFLSLMTRRHGLSPLWFMRTRDQHLVPMTSTMNSVGIGERGIAVHDDVKQFYRNPFIHDDPYYSRTHTGISVFVFLMTLFALEHKISYVGLGNEKGAEDPYGVWDGEVVNHQFDITRAYRLLLQSYIGNYVAENIRLFSPLEGVFEYQLALSMKTFEAREFADITSCNYATPESRWCGQCPKCAWTFSLLSLAFGQHQARHIVGTDLFQRLDVFRNMLDPNIRKPFECVGERPEIWLVLHDCIEQGQTGPVLDYFSEHLRSDFARFVDQYRMRYTTVYPNDALPGFLQSMLADISRP
jgi:hypothetical protein